VPRPVVVLGVVGQVRRDAQSREWRRACLRIRGPARISRVQRRPAAVRTPGSEDERLTAAYRNSASLSERGADRRDPPQGAMSARFDEARASPSAPPAERREGLIRVWVADGHRLLAHALAACLRGQPGLEVAGVSASLDEQAIRHASPDVLVVSYFLLSSDRAAVIRNLRSGPGNVRVVVLAMAQDDQTLSVCVRAGAGACVTREQTPADLADAIERVAGDEILFAPEVLLRLLRRYGDGSREPEGTPSYVLTAREVAVLQAFADGLRIGEVTDRLAISIHTVRSHMKAALTKMDARSRTEAIALAIGRGLIHPPER
jgi:DNA-binding NarL/FixJ family response regulator